MGDYKKVCRCKVCGKIYDKGIPYICSKCGAEIGRPTPTILQMMGSGEVTLQIIQILMENELLEEIKEHVAGHCVWLKNDKEIEEYSASCLASGAYMYWEDFKDKRLPAHKVFIFEGGDF